MTDTRDPVTVLIPWYVNGTLDEEERRQVEAHLPECPRCRALVGEARFSRETAAAIPAADLEEGHVPSRLLVRFQERDEEEPRDDVSDRIEKHLERCAVCRDALSILDELPSTLSSSLELTPGFWRSLGRGFLGPVPALAYLLLVVMLLAWPRARRPEGDPVRALPPATRLHSELIFRTGADERPPATEIPIVDPAGMVLLELSMDLDEEDLDDPAVSFRLDLISDGKTVWTEIRATDDIDRRGRLSLLLDARNLRAGAEHTIVVRLERPGTPDHGLELFRRSFRITASPPR